MKMPLIKKLDIPSVLSEASRLPSIGKLAISANQFAYLDIDDEYVHRLFPLLQNPQIQKPDYFGKGLAGAHVSVVYPEEGRFIEKENIGNEYRFKVKELVTADIDLKKYYVLLVESPGLLQLRRNAGLSDMLCTAKGHWITFHITIGTSPIFS